MSPPPFDRPLDDSDAAVRMEAAAGLWLCGVPGPDPVPLCEAQIASGGADRLAAIWPAGLRALPALTRAADGGDAEAVRAVGRLLSLPDALPLLTRAQRFAQLPAEVRAACERALAWLSARQEPDGRWSARKHSGHGEVDIGVTALAAQALLACGRGESDPTLRRALAFLAKAQRADGLVGVPTRHSHMIQHALATTALAEGSAILRGGGCRPAARRAADYALAARTELGWGYRAGWPANDTFKHVVDAGRPPCRATHDAGDRNAHRPRRRRGVDRQDDRSRLRQVRLQHAGRPPGTSPRSWAESGRRPFGLSHCHFFLRCFLRCRPRNPTESQRKAYEARMRQYKKDQAEYERKQIEAAAREEAYRTKHGPFFAPEHSEACTAAALVARRITGKNDHELDRKGWALVMERPPEWAPAEFKVDMCYWHWASARSGAVQGPEVDRGDPEGAALASGPAGHVAPRRRMGPHGRPRVRDRDGGPHPRPHRRRTPRDSGKRTRPRPTARRRSPC